MTAASEPAAPATAALLAPGARRVLLGLAALGGLAFLYGIAIGDAGRAWQALLVNFLFFGGLAQAGVIFSCILQVTSARWGRPLKRVAEATAAFLPVAFVLLLVLLAGTTAWAPWVHEPVEAKAPWLNVPFFVGRELLAFLVLGGLSLRYVYRSLRPDVGMLHESGERRASGFSALLIRDWRGIDSERATGQRRQTRWAVAVLIAYGWVFTLIAFDFVMALDPHWFSTLLGGYYFIGNLLIGLAFVVGVAAAGGRRLGIAGHVGRHQLHDLGKLLFGFCILWAYLFWSQYLVIWYGDLAEETEFVYHRMHGAWEPVAWAVFAMTFAGPFVVLLSRAVKTWIPGLTTVAAIVFAGMWLERFVLVVPSLWHGEGVPLGLPELLVTAGVAGLFVLSYAAFLDRFPVLPVSDPRLAPAETEADRRRERFRTSLRGRHSRSRAHDVVVQKQSWCLECDSKASLSQFPNFSSIVIPLYLSRASSSCGKYNSEIQAANDLIGVSLVVQHASDLGMCLIPVGPG